MKIRYYLLSSVKEWILFLVGAVPVTLLMTGLLFSLLVCVGLLEPVILCWDDFKRHTGGTIFLGWRIRSLESSVFAVDLAAVAVAGVQLVFWYRLIWSPEDRELDDAATPRKTDGA